MSKHSIVKVDKPLVSTLISEYLQPMDKKPAASKKRKMVGNSPRELYNECLSQQIESKNPYEIDEAANPSIQIDDDEIEISLIEVDEEFEVVKNPCSNCDIKIPALEKEKSELQKELHKFKKLYRTSLQVSLQKDLKLQHMENQFKNNGIEVDLKPKLGEFERFGQFFSEKQLAYLRGLDLNRETDSTFLKSALEYLHKDNFASLENKTVTGKIKTVLEGGTIKQVMLRDCISPQKVEILKELFTERIGSLSENSCPDRRKKRFNSVLSKVVDRFRVDRFKSPRAKRRIVC